MRNRQDGNTLTEYGLVIGLIVILSLTALTLLGKSTSSVVEQSATGLKSKEAESLVTLNFNQGSSGQSAGRVLVIDPNTGLPTMRILDSSASATNATSAEGNTQGVQGTMSTAVQLNKLLPTITDPATRNWAADITKLVYYMGGAQGSYEGIPALLADAGTTNGYNNTKDYDQASAVSDIYEYQNELLELLRNPPAKADTSQVQAVSSLAMVAWNGSQSYIQPYLTDNGSLNTVSLRKSDLNEGSKQLSNVSYDELMSLEVLQQSVDYVLETGQASGTEAQGTLESATTLNDITTTATTSTP